MISKTQEDVSTQDLLIETLIWEAKNVDGNYLNSPEVLPNFLRLINRYIINKADESDEESELQVTNSSSEGDKNLWVDFGIWLGFVGSIKAREVQRHLKNRWKKIQHALDLRNNGDIIMTTTNNKDKTEEIAKVQNNFSSLVRLAQLRYVLRPECITDSNNKIYLPLQKLQMPLIITISTL
nr:1334_t:CDS:2 [Entrophospora candida]